MLISVFLSGYHVLIENDFLKVPSNCTNFIDTKKFSKEDLFNLINNTPVISCKKIVWTFIGLSMASWNLIISIILSFYWILKINNEITYFQK